MRKSSSAIYGRLFDALKSLRSAPSKHVNASALVTSGKLDRSASDWTVETLHATFLKHGCAVVRGIVPLPVLESVRSAIAEAYSKTTAVHVHENDLLETTGGRLSGFELADAPLLQGLLEKVYRGQNWKRDSVTARRIQGVDANFDWQRPLDLHLDSQFHGFQFTVNFWTPFQECGVDAPSLQLIPLNYRDTRQYSGFTGHILREDKRENSNWYFGYFGEGILEPSVLQEQFGAGCFFRPVMNPGDVIVASNWIIHGSYQTPQMKRGRTSAEIRFIGEKQDIEHRAWV